MIKELRKSMNIDDKYTNDVIVAKSGFTKYLSRKTNEHIIKYSKISTVNLKLEPYFYIDL
jgi:hypothetical protein